MSESKSEFDGAVYSGETIVLDTDSSGAEQYRVYSQGSTGFVPQSAVRSNAETRASKFCMDEGKKLKILQERRSPFLQMLGNFPRSELIFVCVDSRTSLGDNSKGMENPKYDQLKNLKKLVDDGLITKQEYQSQKSKILNAK